jgi:hypothetical protein
MTPSELAVILEGLAKDEAAVGREMDELGVPLEHRDRWRKEFLMMVAALVAAVERGDEAWFDSLREEIDLGDGL